MVNEKVGLAFEKRPPGSPRTTVDVDGNVLAYDDYYPFGLTMLGRSSNTGNPNDNYKYTGHELDDEANLNIYYMIARGYDPVLGRFMQIDPLYNEFPEWSPYHYVYNNPLKFTDPTGMSTCDPPEQDCSFIGRIKEMVGITVMDQERPLEVSAIVGLNEIVKQDAIEGVQEALPVIEQVGDAANGAELILAGTTVASGGATAPGLATAGFVSTAADVTKTGLLFYEAALTGGSNDAAWASLGETAGGVVGSKAMNNFANRLVQETGEAVTGPAFMSGLTGRFVSNLQGSFVKYFTPTAAGTAGVAVVNALVKTIFD